MNLQVYGISYKNTDIKKRERYYISENKANSLLLEFKKEKIFPSVIISTCNRTEFYFSEVAYNKIPDSFSKIEGIEAIKHLFRLTSGLESQVLGETEILGQVKNAYFRSLNLGLTDKFFNQVFNCAIKTGKEVRTETKISYGNLSFGRIVFNKTKEILDSLDQKNFLLLGTGELSCSILNYFSKNRIKLKIISGRNFHKAKKLAEFFDTEVVPFERLKSEINWADVIIVATGAPHYLIRKEHFNERKKNCLIFDLSVPRNVDEEVKGKGVFLFNLDDLKEIRDENFEVRKRAVFEAENIIEREIKKFLERWKKTYVKL